jgi:hypothetical protein
MDETTQRLTYTREVSDVTDLIRLCTSRIDGKATLGGIQQVTGYSAMEIEAVTMLIEGGNPL